MSKKEKSYKRIKRIPFKFIPIMTIAFLSINILGLALPLTMKKIYGSVIANRSYNELSLLIFGCLVALFLESILRKARDSSTKWIASKYEYQLSGLLIKKILGSYNHKEVSGSYYSDLEKLKSAKKIASFYSARVYQVFIDLPFILIFLYFIYILGGSIVWVPIVLSILYVMSIMIVSIAYFKHRKAQIKETDEVMAQLTETLDKIHLVKAAGIEDVHISKFNQAVRKNAEREFYCNTYATIPELISSNFSQLNLFTLLIFGGYLITQNRITFGEITACVMLGGRAIAPVKSIMKLYLQRLDIKILKERIDEVLTREDQYDKEAPDFPEDINGTIEILDLNYKNVQTGEMESTTCHIPAGSFTHVSPSDFLSYREIFYRLTSREKISGGKILIDNLNIAKWNMNSLTGKIEYLSESVGIYKGSVIDNITYFNRESNSQAYEAAVLTGLDELVSSMTDGFETQIESHSKNYLSAAFMQRLNLTRALVVRPRILIIDRIDESMDEETLQIFIWMLERFKDKMTILIASNDERIRSMSTHSMTNGLDTKASFANSES